MCDRSWKPTNSAPRLRGARAAWVTAVDHPYFAVTGKDGTFIIKDVPPGKYKIVALHRKGAPTGIEKEIEVKADGATADFTIEVK